MEGMSFLWIHQLEKESNKQQRKQTEQKKKKKLRTPCKRCNPYIIWHKKE